MKQSSPRSLSWSRNSLSYVESEVALPCSQEPASDRPFVPEPVNRIHTLPPNFMHATVFQRSWHCRFQIRSTSPPLLTFQKIRALRMLCITFRNMLVSLRRRVISPPYNPKLEGHPLSAVRECSHILYPDPVSSTHKLGTRHALLSIRSRYFLDY
jgi:hypothetical protein